MKSILLIRRAGIALLLALLAGLPAAQARHARGGAGPSGGGADTVFDYSAGFSGSPAIYLAGGNSSISGSNLLMTAGVSHMCGAAWYNSQPNVASFTTEFTFQIPGNNGWGLVFAIQNSNATSNPTPDAYGINAVGYSANGIGYAGGGGNSSLGNSIGLVFSTSSFDLGLGQVSMGTPVSTVGLFVDGGPLINNSGNGSFYQPLVDIHNLGPNISSDDVMDAKVMYNGTVLTLVLTDTSTSATTRLSWPVNIPAVVGANTAWIGFMSCSPNSYSAPFPTITGWKYATAYNTQLASPTFSVTPGQYTSTQSVALNAAAGASIYYTTNGTPPTTASSQYTGTPISVSSSELINAVAVESNFSDSPVAQGLYRIQSSSTPVINFPSGFSADNGLVQLTGYAYPSGSTIALNDGNNSNDSQVAGAWFAAPISISGNFSTTFTVDLTYPGFGIGTGMAFVLQGYPTLTNLNTNYNLQLGPPNSGITTVSGGPWQLSNYGNNMGYAGTFNSVAVVFEYDSSNNLTGLYTDGAVPTGSSISMTSSGVNLQSGDPFTVNLSYNAGTTTLTETVTDTVTMDQFTHAYTVNIPSEIGGAEAYVGFTAASPIDVPGANLSIASWTF